MANQTYSRIKEGFRFAFGGMKTNVAPDALPPDKYPIAVNIRAVNNDSVRARPNIQNKFQVVGAVTDIRAYSSVGTDNLPRFLARAANDEIWLDNATIVGNLAGGGYSGAAMLSFRPNESVVPYIYMSNGTSYQKFSAPDSSNVVLQRNVGIAEPQFAPSYSVSNQFQNLYGIGGGAGATTAAGTAGAASGTTRVSDTVGTVFMDPVSGGGVNTITVGSVAYSRNMQVTVGSTVSQVLDVFPSVGNNIGIKSIFYFSGTTGRCVIVPKNVGAGPGNDESSVYDASLIATLRRGAVITFNGVSEKCLITSVSTGADGSICFEVTTTMAHTAAETFSGIPAISILGGAPVAGNSITSSAVTSSVTMGIGTLTQTISGFFVQQNSSFFPDDYLHISLKVDDLTKLNEIKFLFDIGDGSFTQNFYYYSIRPNDITAGVANTLTQLGVAQQVSQRQLIDEEKAAESGNQGDTYSGAQSSPGSSQWSEITFPIRELTRVGSDQTRTLQNAAKLQVLVNANGTVSVSFNSIGVWGGFGSDCGDTGAPYRYRVRPRSSTTGVKGNPSPVARYGVSPRRQSVVVTPPSSLYDAQIDTWDVFRYGGTVTSWRKIGQVAAGSASFTDIYSDAAALAGEELEFDNYEPWPTIDVPYSSPYGQVFQVIGTVVLVVFTNPVPAAVTRLLPGNVFLTSNNTALTLYKRPVLFAGNTYIFETVENAGAAAGGTLIFTEPQIAAQPLPYLWGPDAAGTAFGVGDPLRPGTVSFTKNNALDAVPDTYNQEITSPSEPLLGGQVLDGLSFVASTERWWAMYPQPQNPLQRYSVIQQPIPRGIAAPYGICNDGRSIYFWAKDGIWSTSRGSLTDADLYNIFPHEGVGGGIAPGTDYTYAGKTVHAPDYSRAGTFRLAYSNYYLYATYQDSTGTYRCLTYDTRRDSWTVDDYTNQQGQTTPTLAITCAYHPEQQAGTLLSVGGATYPETVFGTNLGYVVQQANSNDFGSVFCCLATREWDGGDARAAEQWGDVLLDCTPASAAGISVTPWAKNSQLSPPTVIPASPVRAQSLVSLGGGVLSNFLGLNLAWSDNPGTQTLPTELFLWQPSLMDKPEMIADRDTDWYFPPTGSSFWQGFVLRADTFNAQKGLQIRDGDSQQTHPFTPVVIHNGETSHAYSFNQPFQAYSVRIEPTDQVPWRFFDVEWIYEDSPEAAQTWVTQGTSFGLTGYMHIKQVSAAYVSSSPITLALTTYDGQSPAPITLPSTGGALQKITFQLTPNKGQLYFFSATASAPFSLYLPDWEILVGKWGRVDGYLRYSKLGGEKGDKALI